MNTPCVDTRATAGSAVGKTAVLLGGGGSDSPGADFITSLISLLPVGDIVEPVTSPPVMTDCILLNYKLK